MKFEEVVMEASKLTDKELASRLLHGFASPVYSVPDEEVRRRVREADADPTY
jgi:hypothetical protein